jgi:hypothetical protein
MEIVYISVDINNYYKEILYLYIIPRLANYNIILGKLWIKNKIYISTRKKTITIKSTRIIINNKIFIKINKVILSEVI